jgi:hypothetical protein
MSGTPRTDADIAIDLLWHRMVSAQSHDLKLHLGRKFTSAIRARNENRTSDEIRELETAKGLG